MFIHSKQGYQMPLKVFLGWIELDGCLSQPTMWFGTGSDTFNDTSVHRVLTPQFQKILLELDAHTLLMGRCGDLGLSWLTVVLIT